MKTVIIVVVSILVSALTAFGVVTLFFRNGGQLDQVLSVEATPVPTPASTPRPSAPAGFRVNIPAINATSEIIKNVDPFDENQYGVALKQGVAHSNTSAFPGQGRTVYLFAHSTNSPLNFTQFNAVFYQLRQLNPGNKIYIDYEGERFTYVVIEKKIVDSNDTHYLYPTDGEKLILQTCDPPGTTFKRLLIFAEPK